MIIRKEHKKISLRLCDFTGEFSVFIKKIFLGILTHYGIY